jgi:hypothetical protein
LKTRRKKSRKNSFPVGNSRCQTTAAGFLGVLYAIRSKFTGQSLYFMCTLCIGSILVGKKKTSYLILAITNLKYSSEIMEPRVPGAFSYPSSWKITTFW